MHRTVMVLMAAPLAALAGEGRAEPAGAMPPIAPAVATAVSAKPVRFADLPPPRRFVTQHRVTIRGRPVAYRAEAGETYIANIAGEPIASFFTFSYLAESRDPGRPVLFVFNGGPGSASIWLHMGAIGPRRVVLDREVDPAAVPPFGLVDNDFSVLDVADLVFVDPVGTGYSHAIGNAKDSDFYSVDADADAASRFIEAWLTEHRRWNSPKYVLGESYGTIRAAVLPRALMGGPLYGGTMRGITLDGVILLGLALDTPRAVPGAGPAKAQLDLPSMAATAFFHGKLAQDGRSAQAIYEAARAYALGPYGAALKGAGDGTLSVADKARIATELESLTGVAAKTWADNGLKLEPRQFLRTLLADRGLEAGAYDSRYTLPLAGGLGDPVADDPAMGRYVPGFIAAFHQMLGENLGVRMPIPYHSITWATLNFNWSYDRIGIPPAPAPGIELAAAMRRNPHLRLLATSGLYDMVTTAAGAEDQLRRAGVPAGRTEVRTYESGHMLYLGHTAPQFADDLRRFIVAGAR